MKASYCPGAGGIGLAKDGEVEAGIISELGGESLGTCAGAGAGWKAGVYGMGGVEE